MPITVGLIVDALVALGGEAHYNDITEYVLTAAQPPFPADPKASVRARLQERCSTYKAFLNQGDLFESKEGSGVWRLRSYAPHTNALREDREDYEAHEGNLVLRTHLERERDSSLVAKFKAGLDAPRCEACSMNFAEVYGDLAIDYIEAHHRTPLARANEGKPTKLEDLAALCPNCHRVIHRNIEMTVEQLADALAEFSVARTTWKEAVASAIRRHVLENQSDEFTRQSLIDRELSNIITEVHRSGETPTQTLSRVLQELRDEGALEFIAKGSYKALF